MSDKVRKNILFNKERDEDILDWLESQDNQAETVRDALRFYMEHKGNGPTEPTLTDVLDEVDKIRKISKEISRQLDNIRLTPVLPAEENNQEPADLVAKLKNFGA